jgi:glycosyltransferase involved in cell wall biosynthesis
MAGIIQDQAYFDAQVAPHIDGERVRFLGPVGAGERSEILGGAAALLHLISFDEPFGLSVVEALACGTPVIAFRRGSMPELIDHGRTGFLVDTTEQAAAAVGPAGGLDRRAIREEAVARFGVDRMVDEYLAAYGRLLVP